MLRFPALYGIFDYQDSFGERAGIIHSAAALLEKRLLIKYERSGQGQIVSTKLYCIAPHFCARCNLTMICNQCLRERN